MAGQDQTRGRRCKTAGRPASCAPMPAPWTWREAPQEHRLLRGALSVERAQRGPESRGHPPGKRPPAKAGGAAGRGEGPAAHTQSGEGGRVATHAWDRGMRQAHRRPHPHAEKPVPVGQREAQVVVGQRAMPAELPFARCSCQGLARAWEAGEAGWLRGRGRRPGAGMAGAEVPGGAAGSTGQMPRTESRAWEPGGSPRGRRESWPRPQPRPSAPRWVSPTHPVPSSAPCSPGNYTSGHKLVGASR